MTSEVDVPHDFPRMEHWGAVPGAQDKFLARLINGKFTVGLTNEERRERYEACEDLAQQLASYVSQKLADDPPSSLDDVLDSVKANVRKKVSLGAWVLSLAEVDWIMNRPRLILADRGVL